MSSGTGRIAIVAGVRLDRAWPELGPVAGASRREQAMPALLEVVRDAREERVDGLILLGGLTSRSTVMLATLEEAWRALEAFTGPVLLVPGPEDWWDDQSPYKLLPPPSNVTVATERDHGWDNAGVAVATSAVTAPEGEAALPRSSAEVAVLVALPIWTEGMELVRPPVGGFVVATDAPIDDAPCTAVPSLCGGGDATFIVADTTTGHVEPRTVTYIEVQDKVLDVTDCMNSRALQSRLDQCVANGFVGRLHLRGVLQSGVVLPDTTAFKGWLDLDWLDYALDDPDPHDQSARAEFVRGLVAAAEEPPRVRHQAIAHGLAAFTVEGDGDAN